MSQISMMIRVIDKSVKCSTGQSHAKKPEWPYMMIDGYV